MLKVSQDSVMNSSRKRPCRSGRYGRKQRQAIDLALLSFCLVVAANCGDGRKSKTLSRETALSLLKEKPGLLRRFTSQKIVVQLPLSIRRARASEDEIAGRVPLELPNLNTLAEVGIVPHTSPFEDFMRGYFVIQAAERGLFFKQKRVENHDYAMRVEYSEIPHPDVYWEPKLDPWGHAFTGVYAGFAVNLTTAQPSFGQVTGIRQEGTYAFVDVEIIYTPTEAQRKMKEIADETTKELGLDPNRFIELCDCHFLEIPKSTAEYRFTLYDDGWRLVSG